MKIVKVSAGILIFIIIVLSLFYLLINGGPQRTKIFRPKLIGEFMMRVVGISYFINRCVSYYEGPEHVEHYEQLFKEQISYKGYEYSFLNLFRTNALGDYRESYSSVYDQT